MHGEPVGVIVLVTLNAAGQAQHIVFNHRPRSAVLLLGRLMNEKFAGTAIGERFTASEP